MNFNELNERIRELMESELEFDLERQTLYLSRRLSESGQENYTEILRTAIKEGSPSSFAEELRERECFKTHEERKKPKGGVTMANVPITAAETLAEGEFNRFYVRAVCRCALEDNVSEVTIYRAKEVRNPREESERMLGKKVAAETLLDDLRSNPGVEPALGLPPGPNSGLSVKIS